MALEKSLRGTGLKIRLKAVCPLFHKSHGLFCFRVRKRCKNAHECCSVSVFRVKLNGTAQGKKVRLSRTVLLRGTGCSPESATGTACLPQEAQESPRQSFQE